MTRCVLCLSLVLGLAGCAKPPPSFEDVPPADELYRTGQEILEGTRFWGIVPYTNYGKAIETFQAIIDNYPYSEYAVQAELAIAENILTDVFEDDGALAEESARMLVETALTLIGTEKREGDAVTAAERLDFNLRRARVLMMTGHKDAAVQLFDEVARGLLPRSKGQEVSFDTPARSLIQVKSASTSVPPPIRPIPSVVAPATSAPLPVR